MTMLRRACLIACALALAACKKDAPSKAAPDAAVAPAAAPAPAPVTDEAPRIATDDGLVGPTRPRRRATPMTSDNPYN